MKRILLAGATGHLGREIARQLRQRGYWIRALVRSTSNQQSIQSLVDEIAIGDVTHPASLKGVCDGIDAVISTVGASLKLALSPGQPSYTAIDFQGNMNLLDSATRAGVRKFVYVSLFGAERLPDLEYVQAHEDFARALLASPLPATIIRPTGFFSVYADMLALARMGAIMSFGAGTDRTNPIHEADLAAVCVDALNDERREIAAGGPETYTRREIAELVFAALEKKPWIVTIPGWMTGMLLAPLRLIDRRMYAFMAFLVAVTQVDVVAPATGTQSLKQFLSDTARAGRS